VYFRKKKKLNKTGMVKQIKLTTLIAKADSVVSKYIRQKNADSNGMVKCVSCPTMLHWKEAHCAHWIGRAAKAVRWLEDNLSVACPSCNVYRKEMHQREYTLYQLDRHGRDGLERIKSTSREVLTGSQVRSLANEILDTYSKLLSELEDLTRN
jgi:hypothetical protein